MSVSHDSSTSRSSTPTTTCTRRRTRSRKHLPEAVQAAPSTTSTSAGARRSSSAGRSASTSPTPPSTSSPARARRRSTSGTATPRGRAAGRSSASRCGPSPAFREPAPALELMDEQGIDRALMFPTLASLLEERMRDDPELTHAVIHALNEWMHETWQFDYEGRIFATPVITLADRREGHRGARVGRRAGRQGRAHPSRAGARLPRARARSALPEFDPFWEKVVEHDILVAHALAPTAATSATPTTGSATSSEMLPFQPQAVPHAVGSGARSRTRSASLICHGALSRFPQLKVAVDRERQQLGRAAASRASRTSTRRCRRTSPRTRSRS